MVAWEYHFLNSIRFMPVRVMLLFPLRRIVFSPEKLVRHLHLTRTSRVLEVGPGPGFFSIDVAQAIPEGRLELVDIQLDMLQKARGRLRRAGVRNTGSTQANAVTLPFRSARSMSRSSWPCSAKSPIRRRVSSPSRTSCAAEACLQSQSVRVIRMLLRRSNYGFSRKSPVWNS